MKFRLEHFKTRIRLSKLEFETLKTQARLEQRFYLSPNNYINLSVVLDKKINDIKYVVRGCDYIYILPYSAIEVITGSCKKECKYNYIFIHKENNLAKEYKCSLLLEVDLEKCII